jgi:hypothetical protein
MENEVITDGNMMLHLVDWGLIFMTGVRWNMPVILRLILTSTGATSLDAMMIPPSSHKITFHVDSNVLGYVEHSVLDRLLEQVKMMAWLLDAAHNSSHFFSSEICVICAASVTTWVTCARLFSVDECRSDTYVKHHFLTRVIRLIWSNRLKSKNASLEF